MLKHFDTKITLSILEHCHIFHLPKQRKIPFHISHSVSNSLFDLVHVDILGPFRIVSLYSHQYFLSIVEDKSRYTWVYLLKSRSEARKQIQTYFSLLRHNLIARSNAFRSDNRFEFSMTHFYSSRGIIHQTTRTYTPQQHAIVERKHNTF